MKINKYGITALVATPILCALAFVLPAYVVALAAVAATANVVAIGWNTGTSLYGQRCLMIMVFMYALSNAVPGCATVKHVARTINDAADIACELFGADHPEALQGLTPAQWCDIKHNIDPFLEEILSAQQRAGATLGVTSGGEAQ